MSDLNILIDFLESRTESEAPKDRPLALLFKRPSAAEIAVFGEEFTILRDARTALIKGLEEQAALLRESAGQAEAQRYYVGVRAEEAKEAGQTLLADLERERAGRLLEIHSDLHHFALVLDKLIKVLPLF